MAVWLIAYQMLNAQEKQACINAIIDRSKDCNIESRSSDIESLIAKLSTTQNIKTLIEAYGSEGISLAFNKQAKDEGCLNNLDNELRDWLEQNQYLKIDNSQDVIDGKQLSIEMKKDIFFLWNQRGYPLELTSGKFCGEQKEHNDFLEFRGEDCKVLVTEYKGRKWLAIEKEAFKKSIIKSRDSTNMPGEDYSSFFQNNNQEMSDPDGNAILFAPILSQEERSIYKKEDAESSRALQEYYAKILNHTDLHKLYLNAQQQNQDIDDHESLLIKDGLMQKIKINFKPLNKIDSCKFPNLKNQWAGTKAEIALGSDAPSMFAPLFSSGTRINGEQFVFMELQSKFALRYDEHGGQVKNEVCLDCADGVLPPKRYDAYQIVIDRPFAFCYKQQHQNGLWDAYCFAVSDPYGQKKITSISNNGVKLKESLDSSQKPEQDFTPDTVVPQQLAFHMKA